MSATRKFRYLLIDSPVCPLFNCIYFVLFCQKVELKHTIEQVHEEQERIVKLETIKKSLEVEIKVSFRTFEQ